MKKKENEVIEDDLLLGDEDELVEGARGNRHFYRHSFSQLFATSPDSSMYLHIVQCELVKPLPNPRYRLHIPQEDSYCLGLLTKSRLPSMGPLEPF